MLQCDAEWCAGDATVLDEGDCSVNGNKASGRKARLTWPVRLPSPSTQSIHLNFCSQPTCFAPSTRDSKTLSTLLQLYQLITFYHHQHHSHSPSQPSPHHHHQHLVTSINMRSTFVFGVAALVAAVAGQTGM